MPVVAKRHRNRTRTDGDGDSESECAPSRSASKSEPEDVATSDVGEISARSPPAAASVREKKNALEDAGVDLFDVIERSDLEATYTALMVERAKKPSANANAKRAKKNDAFVTEAAPALASPTAKKKRAAKVLEYGVDIVDAYRTLGNSSTWDKYASMKADEVKSWLKANNMRHSGTKELNVARCVDGETWGALPGCPRCRAGKLRVRYPSADAAVHDGKGTWTCGGFFDDALGLHQNCYFSADGSDEVVRERWRTKHDPAPKFGSAAAAGSNANANVDARADFVSGFAVLHRSAAAVELLCVARRLKFQLPVDDQQAKVLCLTKLMATKDFEEGVWDGDAALSALREVGRSLVSFHHHFLSNSTATPFSRLLHSYHPRSTRR